MMKDGATTTSSSSAPLLGELRVHGRGTHLGDLERTTLATAAEEEDEDEDEGVYSRPSIPKGKSDMRCIFGYEYFSFLARSIWLY